MGLDRNILDQIVQELYVTEIRNAYGEAGVAVLKTLIRTCRDVYTHVAPETISGPFIVFSLLDDTKPPTFLPDPKRITRIEYLAQECGIHTKDTLALQIKDAHEILLWKQVSINLGELSSHAIVYVYENHTEHFIIRGNGRKVMNPSPVHASVFAVPTFEQLTDALNDYKSRSIRTSGCMIFSEAWHGGSDSKRLLFKNKPEETMRRSLTQYLKNVLREAEVRPEQNVDESHPIDIKVTWTLTNRLALIEIKWLGKSLTDKGNLLSYSDVRARDGAQQLAEYLDANRRQAPTHVTKGYLVVIDARRHGVTSTSQSISRENGFRYENSEITYNPKYHETRSDFEVPIRMFAEPVCSPE